jgi:hypothetical protein
MRLAGSCHQEWGYLAPSRRSMWKMHLFIFAAAIGASASGAVCCSLIYRPAAEASVAERTLMPATEPTASVEKTTDMSQATLRMDGCSPADPGPSRTQEFSLQPVVLLGRAGYQIVQIARELRAHRRARSPQTCRQEQRIRRQ